MASNETASTKSGLRPARRTIVKGAAWAVPAVAVASAAPAFAASQFVTVIGTGAACKSPGGSCEKDFGISKGYFISVEICTDVRGVVTIDFGTASVSLNNEPATSGWTVAPDPLVFPYDGEVGDRCQTVVLGIQGEPNSQNVSIEGTGPFTWSSSNGLSGSGTMTFSATSTPPCPECGVVPPPSTNAVVEESKTTVEAPVTETVEEPVTEDGGEPAPGADTESSTASPQG